MFEVATMDTEGHKRAFWDYYITLSWMLDQVDAFRVEFKEEASKDTTFSVLSDCCSHAWQKVEKYYVKCDQTPVVYAAVMLHPAKKHHWFKERWDNGTKEQRTWASTVKVQVEELWRKQYKTITTPPETRITANEDSDNLHIQLYNYKRLKLSKPQAPIDALSAYLDTDAEPDTKELDPLHYWYNRRYNNPDLARFAFDTLAIPLMSDDPERSFSAARDMITYRRNQLSDDIIEACACLRSWYGPPKKEDEMFDKEEAILEQFRQVQHLTEQVVNEDEGPEDSYTSELAGMQHPS